MSVKAFFKPSPLKVVAALTLVVLLAEAGAYAVIAVLGKNFYYPLALSEISEETIPDDMRARFSPELGWYPDPSQDAAASEPADDTALAVFGDEYTSGRIGTTNPWPTLLEGRLGQPVSNFAVGAYGPGQAYLRYEENQEKTAETPYVALVMMSGASARAVNRYRGFYSRGTQINYPKPMFHKTDDGEVELLPNPVGSVDELTRLGDPAFLDEIGEDDYWHAYYGTFGLNEHVGFPYSLHLAKAVPYYVQRWRDHSMANRQSYQTVYEDEEAVEVMATIVERFVARAKAQGAVPIFVMLPNRPDMANFVDQGGTAYDAFLETLKAGGHPHIHDGLDFFKPHLEAGEGVDAFYRSRSDDALTPRAAEVIAEAMHRLLLDIDATEKRLDPSITTSEVVR